MHKDIGRRLIVLTLDVFVAPAEVTIVADHLGPLLQAILDGGIFLVGKHLEDKAIPLNIGAILPAHTPTLYFLLIEQLKEVSDGLLLLGQPRQQMQYKLIRIPLFFVVAAEVGLEAFDCGGVAVGVDGGLQVEEDVGQGVPAGVRGRVGGHHQVAQELTAEQHLDGAVQEAGVSKVADPVVRLLRGRAHLEGAQGLSLDLQF